MRQHGTADSTVRAGARTRSRVVSWVAVALAAGLATAGCTAAEAAGPTSPATTASVDTAPLNAAPLDAAPAGAAATPEPTAASPAVVAAPATSAAGDPTAEPAVATSTALRPGASGPAVLTLQQRLSDLGYWLGTPDGSWGSLTTQAVYALQGAAGLRRDGVVGPATQAALDAGTRPTATTTSGHAVEIDRERGLVLFVDAGAVSTVLHTSTGTFKKYVHEGHTYLADTPEGTFRVSRAVAGWREGDLGRLYAPRYFHPDGIAVHGYGSVPAYPASHGCARVSLAAMDMVWAKDLMPVGSTVVVR